MKVTEVHGAIRRFAYKPGWHFAAIETPWHGLLLRIVVRLPDGSRPGESTDLGVDTLIPCVALTDEEALKRWMLNRIIEAEVHEAREFLRFDDVLVDDPHAPVVHEKIDLGHERPLDGPERSDGAA